MPKLTPAQRVHNIFKRWTTGSTPDERATGERMTDQWLAKHGKTRADIGALLAEAHADDLKANPTPPPPDPRDAASVRFDPKRHNPASLVENLLKVYVTMSEPVLVVFVLAIVFTHVYTRYAIAPRITLTSKRPESGKSTALEIGRLLAFKPNEEAIGTGAAIEEHFSSGPCSLFLDEAQYIDAKARDRIQRIWNMGHKSGPGSVISKMEAGKKRRISLHAPVFLAGVGKGIGRLLAMQQQSRTLRLEMQKYTEATKPPRDFYIEGEVDFEAFKSVYSLLCRWAEKAKLNPKPLMPAGVIARDADNIRGLLAIADDCGGEWPWRAREALMVLLEQRQAQTPAVIMLRHCAAICDMLELERVRGTELDRELRRLDLPDASWNRYRGPGGDEHEHPITAGERAELLREHGIESKVMKPPGGGKAFRGYERAWFEEALREYEPAKPRLRLITPQV
jgi:hypothetical protein